MTAGNSDRWPRVYLFDWGDTLMVDDASAQGKMCDWPKVEAVDGAFDTLRHLAGVGRIYIATGAQDSEECDIRRALARVGLERWISGVFCQANLGVGKGDSRFLPMILQKLSIAPNQTAMVGDNLQKDVMPALATGVTAIWLNPGPMESPPEGVRVIRHLAELI